MNKKELKVLRLSREGMEPKLIARRLGYTGNSITAGIEYVNKIISGDNTKLL